MSMDEIRIGEGVGGKGFLGEGRDEMRGRKRRRYKGEEEKDRE